MNVTTTPTNDEVIAELEREHQMRLSLYPKWVDSGQLREQVADHRLACVFKALEIVKAHRIHEQGQQTLFDAGT